MTDFTDAQCRWLASRPADYAAFLDQFIDLFDFGYGTLQLGHERQSSAEAGNLLGLPHFHLQAAAAIVTGAYDRGGAVQSGLIAMELALKAVLANAGFDENARKRLGHDVAAMSREVGRLEPGFDADRVQYAISGLPKYQVNRYSAEQPDRRTTGSIIMTAQFVGAEVMRQLSGCDMRAKQQCPPPPVFPSPPTISSANSNGS